MLVGAFLCFGQDVTAQSHNMHQHHAAVDSSDTIQSAASHEGHASHADMAHVMPSILSPNIPMNMEGSGTSWHPEATPMEGVHGNSRGWQLMLHGRSFARYTNQDIFSAGYRGAQTFGAPTWVMGMATRSLTKRSQLSFRAMFTGEPFTEGGDGYPLLFQTGETYKDIPLVDWQHPHDLVAELSVTYSYMLSNRSSVYLYAALPGEPSIGPPAFMHRPSARHLADSPIGHHWQDATHVTFGVGTLGFIHGPIKIDASIFTGREPDEKRLRFDKPRFDSYSARLSINLNPQWAFQASRAYMKSPEVHAPDIDMWRTAVSLLYGRNGAASNFSSALVWGMNDPTGNAANHAHITGRNGDHLHAHTVTQHSFLAEADLNLRKTAVYTRMEYLQKDGAELGIADLQDNLFWIGSCTIGAAREVISAKVFDVMAGVQTSIYSVPEALKPSYGDLPFSGQIYLRLNLR